MPIQRPSLESVGLIFDLTAARLPALASESSIKIRNRSFDKTLAVTDAAQFRHKTVSHKRLDGENTCVIANVSTYQNKTSTLLDLFSHLELDTLIDILDSLWSPIFNHLPAQQINRLCCQTSPIKSSGHRIASQTAASRPPQQGQWSLVGQGVMCYSWFAQLAMAS